MKWSRLMVMPLVALVNFCEAADVPPSATPPSAVRTEATGSGAGGNASFQKLKRGEFELTTTLKVLAQLAEEHALKADEATKAGQGERAAWEKDWAQRLDEKRLGLSKELTTLTRQSLALEQAQGTTSLGFGPFETSQGASPDEITYVTFLQDRLSQVQQELAATIAAGVEHTAELRTNNTPEIMTKVSALMLENRYQVRELEKEQADLELRKLEFRALRK